eukprot:scaffold21992_cov100-Phaeocystis_antarctica.AAC.6
MRVRVGSKIVFFYTAEPASNGYGTRDPPPRQTGDGGLLRIDRDGFSSFVRRKRSERRWAVDEAVGRAKQGRSTWPWSAALIVDATRGRMDEAAAAAETPSDWWRCGHRNENKNL